jgi:hypothetical protein
MLPFHEGYCPSARGVIAGGIDALSWRKTASGAGSMLLSGERQHLDRDRSDGFADDGICRESFGRMRQR